MLREATRHGLVNFFFLNLFMSLNSWDFLLRAKIGYMTKNKSWVSLTNYEELNGTFFLDLTLLQSFPSYRSKIFFRGTTSLVFSDMS